MSKLSVVVPVYNGDKYLNRCIDSILNQSYSDFDLVLVDDGSTDQSGRICDEYKRIDNRVHVIHKKNCGNSAAINTAFDYISTEFVAFLDADDYANEDYLSVLMQNSNYDFVSAGYSFQKKDGSWQKRIFEDLIIDRIELSKHPSKYLGKYYFASPWATLMKTSIIKENNLRFPEDVNRGQDIIFTFSYLKHINSIRILPYCSYFYCFYNTSLVNTIHRDFYKWAIQFETQINNFFNPDNNSERVYLYERNFTTLFNLLRAYYNVIPIGELKSIFNNPLFSDCIEYYKNNGNRKEKLLIRSMEKDDYNYYLKRARVYNAIERIFHYK